MLPISTVKKEGFKKLIRVLDLRFELPGWKHFPLTARPQLYVECMEMVEQQLQTISFFATTSDMQFSCTSEPFVSLTIRFIDKDWNLQSKCL